MKTRSAFRSLLAAGALFAAALRPLAAADDTKQIVLKADVTFQAIDGFGVNFNPAHWRNGELKPTIDLLLDDLGCTLVRFDCYGTADWLDPRRRDGEGHYPADYLREVYTQPVFRDAWAAFRYFNSNGIEPFFNVSGRIPAALAGPDGQTLVDKEGYAEMAVTLLQWARNEEGTHFSLFSPFNETDLGFPEGPKARPEAEVEVTRVILRRMAESGCGDVKLIAAEAAKAGADYVEPYLRDPTMAPLIGCFGAHFYGDGREESGPAWFSKATPFAAVVSRIRDSPYKDCPLWLTEYGDLDQSGKLEWEVGWRSTRRLLRALRDGVAAGLVWDAFDNFHVHDNAWTTYGLLKTDRARWTYEPKPRYHAAKQVFRFVRPGFRRVELAPPDTKVRRRAAASKAPLPDTLLCGFVSEDKRDYTVVGMSTAKGGFTLNAALEGLAADAGEKPVAYYRTSRTEACRKVAEIRPGNNALQVRIEPDSIFTLTTVR